MTAQTTEGLFYAEVLDKTPTGLTLTTGSSTVTAGSNVNLSGSLVAPTDPNDVYQVVVNWGDGSTSLGTIVNAGGNTFSVLT